jgi:hypothetical protein
MRAACVRREREREKERDQYWEGEIWGEKDWKKKTNNATYGRWGKKDRERERERERERDQYWEGEIWGEKEWKKKNK